MAAALNWRDFPVADCEFSVKALNAIWNDHGPNATLGMLASKTDEELVRSAHIGRKTLKEIRSMIDYISQQHPDPAPQRPIFIPHATIDWSLLARAVDFYQAQGFKYVEMPWAVSRESVAITCPKPEFTAEVDGLGSLVGSAEQSFLHMDLAGKLGKGRFCALTPCFRLGDYEDDLHHPYFMKVELYANNAEGISVMMGDEEVAPPEARAMMSLLHMMSIVGQFNRSELTAEELANVHGVQTAEGYDIELNGIEIGSYGVRQHGDHTWVYGTGVAEPRFSQARRA
ncbi:histidyl tRNA synthetase [Caulobacter phage CcrPW]|uniref:RNA polymerase alpha subunit C-terminal domain-containing protein n=1 Tax=Caulobacter phage CcrPW TaxID=2283271 RepID=A0A385ED89_9CAUD|nr:histidyl tRNA synthetase [Caulobacter phage CcrPW]AXQ68679.1 hypothetical protein CcrPW_gp140 [Caulobacter phage CcrPW]